MARRTILTLVSTCVLACALGGGASRATAPQAWRVIVNPANPAAVVERRFLADVFLKKTTRWPTGDGVKPVDQRDESPVRQRFSEDVVGRSVAAVKNYWAQLVFSGRELPPPELESDEDVVRFVAKNAGGIGYISPSAAADRVKVLTVR